MKFIVSSSDLLKNLQVLGTILNTNNTLPILDNFLFEIENNELNITSSDLETSLTSKLSIESSLNIKIAIPAKLLTDIIRSLPEQPLTFSINENNTIEINSNNGKYGIAYMDGNEYPKSIVIEDASEISLDSSSLEKIISSTLFASSIDEGKSWSNPKIIYNGEAAYSSMTVMENGNLGLFFEMDNYTKNVFTSISIKDVLTYE